MLTHRQDGEKVRNKMKRSEIVKQVRKEYTDMKKWNRSDRRHCSVLMYDKADGEVWADCFQDENSYKEYHSETIFKVPVNDLLQPDGLEKIPAKAEIIKIIANYIIKNLHAGVLDEDK